MYKLVTSEQRSQIFVLLRKKTSRKEIARLMGISGSTLSRELERNSTKHGRYVWVKAQEKADKRRKRTASDSRKDPVLVWEALELLKEKQWPPKQISGKLFEGRSIYPMN